MIMAKPNNIPPDVLTEGLKNIDSVKLWGHYLAGNEDQTGKMTSSQLRKFFGAIKRIQADFDNLRGEIVLLEPKLAYAVGRDYDKKNNRNQTKIKAFYDLMSPLIRAVNEDKKRFKHFVDVSESIVAYHKEKSGD